MRKPDQGMTLLEVVFAITILLIGAGFMAQSNSVTYKYRAQNTEYKQMLFYAAGQMDAIIAKQEDVSESVYMPFKSYIVTPFDDGDVEGLGTYLEVVGVEVSSPGGGTVEIFSYRLR